MCKENNQWEKKRLENAIARDTEEINSMKQRLKEKEEQLLKNKNRLDFIMQDGTLCLKPGTSIIFKDLDGRELKSKIVRNSQENYNLLLLTDYSDVCPSMDEYYIFNYNCIYSDTLIEMVEEDMNWKLLSIIKQG